MGKKSEIEKLLHEEIIRMSKEIQGTEAVYRGNDPEEHNMVVYYLLIPGECNFDITDKITEIDLTLSVKYPEFNFSLMRWPTSSREISDYPFLGKCIYQK